MSYFIDPYDVLFCECDGTTTAFVDSSTASVKSLTAVGGAAQLPTKFNKSAASFGNGNYVVGLSPAVIGTGDFTVEFFVMFDSLGIYHTPISWTGAGRLVIQMDNAINKMRVWYDTNIRITESTAAVASVWYHYALVRTGGVMTLYRDAVDVGQYNGTDDYSSTSSIQIGRYITTSHLYGWMKELRISNVARTVSVPTQQYVTDENTTLLLHCDTPATACLGPALYFDGSDYLTLVDHADWNFGANDFTVESFVCFTVLPTGTYYASFVGQYGAAGNKSWVFYYKSGTGLAFTYTTDGTTTVETSNAWTPSLNTWYHLAVKRSSNTLTMYISGIAQATTKDVTGITFYNSSQDLHIGGNPLLTLNMHRGYMKEIRISSVGRYTTNFTPPQNGFTVDSDTKLYIKAGEDNGSGQTLVPVMTSASAPYGNVYQSTDQATYEGWRAFDNLSVGANGSWMTSNGNTTGWVAYKFSAATAINSYCIQGGNTVGRSPNAWTLQGSNDTTNGSDGNWTVLDTQTGITWSAAEVKRYNFTNAVAYLAYKLVVTANNGDATNLQVWEIDLLKKISDSEATPKEITVGDSTVIRYYEDYRSGIFKDETGKFLYPIGNAKVDFCAPMDGAAGLFLANGDAVTIPDSADWDMDADFTLEAYGRWPIALSGVSTIFARNNGADNIGIQLYHDGTSTLYGRYNVSVITSGAFTPVRNVWYHFAFSRHGTFCRLWLNGQQIGTTTIDNAAISYATAMNFGGFRLNNSTYGTAFKGRLDGLRITKGLARYTKTFNPPVKNKSVLSVNGISVNLCTNLFGVPTESIQLIDGMQN